MTNFPRLAVFGCGYWGNNHIRTLKEIGALACVVDQDFEIAQKMAVRYDSVAVTANDVFADDTIEGIVMALPAEAHAATALQAFDVGKHVFAEKPIALSVSDAEAMVAASKKADRILMSGHILRYHNAFLTMMKLINEGALGTIKYVQSHRLGFGKFHDKFDAVWDLAPHDLSLLLSVAGHGPASVSNRSISITNGQVDFAHIDLDFGDSLKGHVYVSRYSPYAERRFTIIGDKAMAVWDDMEQDWGKKVSLHEHNVFHDVDGWTYSKEDTRYIACEPGMALTDELTHFMQCIRDGNQPLTDGTQGLAVVRILNAVS